MEMSKGTGYVLHKVTDNNYCLCKILKEYESQEEAQEDLVELLVGNTTEKKLLKENK